MARATLILMQGYRCGSGIRRYPLKAFGILPVGVIVERDKVAFSELVYADKKG